MQVLLARDAVAQAAAGTTTAEALAELTGLDGQLQAAAPLIVEAVGGDTLARWRASAGPPPSAWWWALDEIAAAGKPKPWIGWAILAGLFITLSVSFIAEISARFLAGQPDFFGVFSTLSQALLALAGRRRAHPGRRPVDRRAARRARHRPGPRTPAGRPRSRSWC